MQGEYWYIAQPRGKHYLNNMIKSMCQEANMDDHFTNHSLRASGASSLFQSEVPEKIIQGFTGHRSLNVLRQYEQVGTTQKQVANNCLLVQCIVFPLKFKSLT